MVKINTLYVITSINEIFVVKGGRYVEFHINEASTFQPKVLYTKV